MNEKQYLELCETCDRVLLAPDSKMERVAIPWLHVIREHPVFLKNYNDIFESKTWFADFKFKWLKIIRNFASLLLLLIRTSIKKGQFWHDSEELTQNIDFLFISHLLNASLAGKEEDFYFGKVPGELVSQGHNVLIALINHSGHSGSDLVIKWNKSFVPRVILSGFLGISQEITSLRQLIKESGKLKKHSKTESSKLDRKVLMRASMEALSNSSQTSLRINKQIGALVARLKPKVIIVTHEGHAWERVAFAAARIANPGIICVGYQHAAIFRLQHAISRSLNNEFNPDIILSSGLVGKAQLECATNLRNIPVSILGSNRGFISTKSNYTHLLLDLKPDHSKSPACLVIPEGDFGECNLLFEFSIECARICPQINFIWRLHPLITFKTLILRNSKLRFLPSNIILSKETIEEDISHCSWALYRGTTAIIKGVGAGLKPIYLQVANEMTIDPLYELEIWKTIVRTIEDFKKIIVKDIEKGQHKSKSDLADAQKYCESFYLPFDSSRLVKLLPIV